jgi:hypothetical protein
MCLWGGDYGHTVSWLLTFECALAPCAAPFLEELGSFLKNLLGAGGELQRGTPTPYRPAVPSDHPLKQSCVAPATSAWW